MVGYYRRFIEKLFVRASLLTTLTRKAQKFEWIANCEESFWELKGRLTSALLLTLLNSHEAFFIYTNASRSKLGCVLIHEK